MKKESNFKTFNIDFIAFSELIIVINMCLMFNRPVAKL